MIGDLGRLRAPRLTGEERFQLAGKALDLNLLGFWQWSVSDLVSNATRGRLAEYIVARALGLSDHGVRDEWAAYDLITAEGIRIEVKSASYLQSWYQKKPSTILFSVRASRAWNPETNEVSKEARRQADLYVLALLAHADKATLNPLDLDQWSFFVVPTKVLDARTRSQHSITLPSLGILGYQAVSFGEVGEAVGSAASEIRARE
jgi:hypothetical protein